MPESNILALCMWCSWITVMLLHLQMLLQKPLHSITLNAESRC